MANESIRSLIADDDYAISFQSLGQYRSALLDELDMTSGQTNPIDEKELIDLDCSLRVTANSLDHFGQCHVVPPSLLRRAAAFILKQDARIAELETQSTRPSQDTRTDDDLLRFLDKQDQWLINGELEESRDGKVRWTYTHELNSYDGDDEWESMDATDTLLDLIRHIRNPSHKNIREPVVFRVPLKNPSSSIYLEACNRERTKWVVRCAGKVDKYLNKDGEWETSADLYPEFLRKFSWPTKEEARNAFLARPEPLTVVQKQAARIAELEALLQEKTVKREP